MYLYYIYILYIYSIYNILYYIYIYIYTWVLVRYSIFVGLGHHSEPQTLGIPGEFTMAPCLPCSAMNLNTRTPLEALTFTYIQWWKQYIYVTYIYVHIYICIIYCIIYCILYILQSTKRCGRSPSSLNFASQLPVGLFPPPSQAGTSSATVSLSLQCCGQETSCWAKANWPKKPEGWPPSPEHGGLWR